MNEEEPMTDLDRELDAMLSAATPVNAKIAKNLSHVISIRLSSAELQEFSRAAAARNMNLSEFMRTASKAVSVANVNLKDAGAVSELKEKMRELNEAIERLTA